MEAIFLRLAEIIGDIDLSVSAQDASWSSTYKAYRIPLDSTGSDKSFPSSVSCSGMLLYSF